MLQNHEINPSNISQFQLINRIYKSKLFEKVELKPTAKLVLYALVHHYNPNNEDMFPSQKFIAQSLGISEKSVERAVKELAASRLIMYVTKNVNRYKFTANFFELVNLSDELRQNVGQKHRQNVGQTYKHEQKKNNVSFISSFNLSPAKPEKNTAVQETRLLLDKYDQEKQSAASPKDLPREQAKKWLDSLPPQLHNGILAQEVYKKYNFVMSEKVRQILILNGKLKQ